VTFALVKPLIIPPLGANLAAAERGATRPHLTALRHGALTYGSVRSIAVHLRSSGNGKHTTLAEHMPSSHRRYADWTVGRIRRDAALIGPIVEDEQLRAAECA
jgi:transposase